jgi:hypothetical protein
MPVICTRAAKGHFPSMACTETQSINQRRVGGGPGSFWTACERAHLVASPWLASLKLKRHHAIIDGPGFESAQAWGFDHLASRRAQRGLPMLPVIHSVINSGSDAFGVHLGNPRRHRIEAMALGPADHNTLANMQRSVKGAEFFILGGSYGAFSSGAVSFWARENRLSPLAGCRGQAMVSRREGMDIP